MSSNGQARSTTWRRMLCYIYILGSRVSQKIKIPRFTHDFNFLRHSGTQYIYIPPHTLTLKACIALYCKVDLDTQPINRIALFLKVDFDTHP
jgi:hypothetical protein